MGELESWGIGERGAIPFKAQDNLYFTSENQTHTLKPIFPMQKQLLFIISLVSLPLLVQAQFKLDVDGSARIIGQLDLNVTGNSVLIGTSTGQAITTGTNNIFVGYLSGQSNTTGSNNVFSGRLAGVSNTTGSFNTFLGSNAGRFNDTGTDNVFMGGNSGWSNTTGNQNTFIGQASGIANTSGNYQYALFVGGQMVATKRMVRVK